MSNATPSPSDAWHQAILRVLIPARRIQTRVRALAREIQRDHRDADLVVIPLLSGTVVFVADLIRHLDLPLRLDFMGVSSYRDATRPGALRFTKELRLDVRGRDVLLVDDILDTGRTLEVVTRKIARLRPQRLRTCVLLEKQIPRATAIRPDYVGFRIPDVFVIGYGLDYAERYRNLPYLGVLRAP